MIPPYMYMQPTKTKGCPCSEPMPMWAEITLLIIFIAFFIMMLPLIIETVEFVIEGYKELFNKMKEKFKRSNDD